MSLHYTFIRFSVAAAVVAITIWLVACDRSDKKPGGPNEKITIAYATLPETVLAQVAQSRGFYREEGLEAYAHLHPYGKRALEDMLAGKADFATVAETPVMLAIMKGEKISVIATILTSNLGHAILARRDRGILTPRDLKGKKIAATLGTTSHYFLDVMLLSNGIARSDVKLVNLKAEEIPNALANGDIDAVSTFTPYTTLTQKKLGDRLIIFHDKDIYTYHFNVVSSQEFIRKNPDKIRKILRALIRSEAFVRGHPSEAQKIVADFSGIDIDIVRDIWADANFTVALDQSLVLAMEDESQWAIKNGLTKTTEVPNYLDFIYFDGLKSVKPEAVRIVR